jgi:phosphodiesterase/alkaline phosphatase D-like protein
MPLVLDQLANLNASWHAARVSAGREMLGPQQLTWLRDGIANASADAVTWQMI